MYKKMIFKMLLKLFKSRLQRQQDEIIKQVGDLFAQPLEKLANLMFQANMTQEQLEQELERIITIETPNFLIKAQDIAKNWRERKNRNSELLNHTSKPYKFYDNDQSE